MKQTVQRFTIGLFFTLILTILTLVSFSSVSAQDVKSPVNSPIPGIEHVVLIGSDGFGAHYVHWDELPNLKKMKENGAWTLKMRSVLPSSSAINWASILMGAPSEIHGYRTWGSQKPDLPPLKLTEKGMFPCIFSILKDQCPNSKSAVVFHWDGIGFLFEKTAVETIKDVETDEDVLKQALAILPQKPELTFIYFDEPDEIGHHEGWGSEPYQKMLTLVDDYVGQIFKCLEENDMLDNTLVLFISDHGGTAKGHGDGILEHMEVPYILYGPGVKKGEITDAVVNYDNAATIAWILGLKQPQVWRGLPLKSAFEISNTEK